MGLRDIGMALPPGFRFYPSDEELVCHYLYKKIANEEVVRGTLVDVDLHTCEPWQLPDVAKLNSSEWYFFSFRDRKYATGYRTNRATTSGYWKATGKDRAVVDPCSKAMVGMRKTLVFYKNRAPNGIKTGWIMHEFRLENPNSPPKEDWVLCRVFNKSRGENIGKFNTQGVYSPTQGLTCLNTLQSMPNYHHHHHIEGPQNPSIALASSPRGCFFPLSHDADDENLIESGPHSSTITTCNHDHGAKLWEETKYGDDYRFLFDSGFDCVVSTVDGDDMRLDHDSTASILI